MPRKPKATPQTPPPPARLRERKLATPRVSFLSLKATPEYAEWFRRLADHARCSQQAMLDQAVARYAQAIGFTEAPPLR